MIKINSSQIHYRDMRFNSKCDTRSPTVKR